MPFSPPLSPARSRSSVSTQTIPESPPLSRARTVSTQTAPSVPPGDLVLYSSSSSSYSSSASDSDDEQHLAIAGSSKQRKFSNFSLEQRTWIITCVFWARDGSREDSINDFDRDTLIRAVELMRTRPQVLAGRDPSHRAIRKIMVVYQDTGSAQRSGKGGRKSRVEGLEAAEYLLRNTEMSLREIAAKLTRDHGVQFTPTFVHTIQKKLKLRFYRTVGVQMLSDHDVERRKTFADKWHRTIGSESVDIDDICFTDESMIPIGRSYNRRNDGFRREKGDADIEHRLRQQQHKAPMVHVFCLLNSRVGVIGPYFIDDIHFIGTDRSRAHCLTSEKYIRLLRERVFPELRRRLPEGYDFRRIWWQQDGAPCHTATASLNFLRSVFGRQIISNKTDEIWPPNSPDLNPLDYWFWNQLKVRVGVSEPDHPDTLKVAIRNELPRFTIEEVKRAINDFPVRIMALRAVQGGHFEPTLKKFKKDRNIPTTCDYCHKEHACPCRVCDDICIATVMAGFNTDEIDDMDIDD